MNDELRLSGPLYPMATPAGAFYAVAGAEADLTRRLLLNILRLGHAVPLSEPLLSEWCDDELEQALATLYRLQRLEFVHGTAEPRPAAAGNLESQLPELLAALSGSGQALLADDNGLYYATAGFRHETAEEIAALAGDLMSLSRRHHLLLKNHLNLGSAAWAAVDPVGRSQLAFYPLHVAQQAFALIIGGEPRLQSEAFVGLVELLVRRYA
ncbi:hypothetical protein HNO92_002864 [Chromobacterium alkanivorans]|uniref:peptidase M23 n=1 Tax=Chromobacterium alkanivorans TaxID=1071719 RepID=UPI0021674940|nr:peptidase M23 [Chromobacterium alkanivorans]MCS3803628.1 hypothetical protein [Chromobacterium alkanivorans]MCS3818267.1 hypothetical protein [Chromobacterium alkanivorans]MCS3874534.1 hypothetical protein [Chromobacterium alkanivorans]